MALIGKIREKSGLVLGLVAVAVFGFILQDVTQGGPRGSKASIFDNPNTMGTIDGTKINRQEFEKTKGILYNGSKADALSIQSTLWNFFVEKAIVEKQAEDAGLGVSETELNDLQFGADPSRLSPIIQQRYGEQLADLPKMKENLESPEAKKDPRFAPQIAYWKKQEEEILKERLQTKLNTMVSKGAYTPKWMATMMYADQNNKADFTYVKIPSVMVKDADAAITDADYKTYMDENKGLFLRKREGRIMSYAVFNVIPTSADSQAVAKKVADLIPGFQTAKSDSNYVLINNGGMTQFIKKKDITNAKAADEVFAAATGAIVGPYVDNGAYTISKVVEKRTMPDSVTVRHILISNKQVRTDSVAKKLADSLFAVVKGNPASFAALAAKFSDDPGSKDKGGSYTWSNSAGLYPEYYDYCFKTGKIGDFKIVKTAMGGYHIMNITKNIGSSPLVRLATIVEPIEPSTETQDKIRDRALTFAQQNRSLDSLAKRLAAENVKVEATQPLEENDFQIGALGGNAKTREMVRWANNAKVGQVSSEIYDFMNEGQAYTYTNRYVIAGLRSILPEGMPNVADIKADYEAAVKNRKKGEVLKAKLAGKDPASVLAMYGDNPNIKIDTARQASFGAQYLPGLGSEPKVIATVFNTAQGAVTEPIIGSNGVYVAQVQARVDLPAPADMTMMQKQMSNMARNQVRSRLMPALKDKANVKDYRAKQGF